MAVLEDKECCNSCLFFVNGERMGICRRFPSAVNKPKEEWCGEFAVAQKAALTSPVEVFSDMPDTIENLVAVAELEEKRKPGRPKLSRRQIP